MSYKISQLNSLRGCFNFLYDVLIIYSMVRQWLIGQKNIFSIRLHYVQLYKSSGNYTPRLRCNGNTTVALLMFWYYLSANRV